MVKFFKVIIIKVKFIIFFIALFGLCIKTNYTEEPLKDSSLYPINIDYNYSQRLKDTPDVLALKEGRLQDISNIKSLKMLDIKKDRFILALLSSPGIESYEILNSFEENGIAAESISLLLSLEPYKQSYPASSQGYSAFEQSYPEESDCSLTLYNYKGNTLAMKFSQLIPFKDNKLIYSSAFALDFLKLFLGEDAYELQDTIIDYTSDPLYQLLKTNNSSQNYFFIYGNYGINLSLFKAPSSESSLEGNSVILNIYIYSHQ